MIKGLVFFFIRIRLLQILLLTGMNLFMLSNSQAQEEDHLIELSLEQLLNVEVSTPSRQNQKSSAAPASISVITAEEIRTYGYRTLADVLNSVRGIYMSHDHIYDYIGVRGFSRPGDFSSRVLLMIDGYRVNENVFDQSFYGQDFLLDIDLIKRVEIIRGPSSSVYGSNALLGVVNVITRSAQDIGQAEAALGVGDNRDVKTRASMGRRLDNGMSLLLSATAYHHRGESLQLEEPEFNNATSQFGHVPNSLDQTKSQSLFARISQDNWQFQTAHVKRDKGNPVGFNGTLTTVPGSNFIDQQGQFGLRYLNQLDDDRNLSARIYYGYYNYRANSLLLDSQSQMYTSRDEAQGRWWGSELAYITPLNAQHTLTTGVDAQFNTRQNQRNYDYTPTYIPYLNDAQHSQRIGVYMQDDYQINSTLSLSAGLRADKFTQLETETSPRLALIYQPNTTHTWKLLYGTAFRAPNAYERNYSLPDIFVANPKLTPEHIRTLELIHERYLSPVTKATGSLYGYQIKNLIDQGTFFDGTQNLAQFQNKGSAKGQGLELELEHQWHNGARIRGSVTRQLVQADNGSTLTNSPPWQFKLNASAPILETGWRAALEVQSMGSRLSSDSNGNNTVSSSYARSNLTLRIPLFGNGTEWSLSVYNLFNRHYGDPVGADAAIPSRSMLGQDRRSWMGRVVMHF